MIEFQPLSDSVYNKKYQLFDKYGDEVDHDRLDTFRRVAIALAKNEKDPDYWTDQFYTAMVNGAIPAGRILSNAGAEKYKPNTSLINCTLSRIVEDSITGIGEAVKEAMVTLSSGAGIGYEFSTLRPRGAFVNGVGSSTSGPYLLQMFLTKHVLLLPVLEVGAALKWRHSIYAIQMWLILLKSNGKMGDSVNLTLAF